MHVICRKIILIHQHAILDILITGNRSKIISISCVTKFQSSYQVISPIRSRESRSRKVSLTCLQIKLSIRESILIYILVISKNIHLPTRIKTGFEKHLASSFIILVRTVAGMSVSEETILSLIEASQRKSNMLIELLIMSRFYIAEILTAIAQSDVTTLVIERITGIHLDQSTLSILTIQCALWPSKHINSTHLVIMEIKC